MKVIFIKDVARMGQRGQLKEVSDGYALNFLIPGGFAEQATADKVSKVQERMREEAAHAAVIEKEQSALAKKLDGMSVTVAAKANEKGHFYKNISQVQIALAIKEEHRIDVIAGGVILPHPIKEIGETAIEIKIGNQTAKMTLIAKVQ